LHRSGVDFASATVGFTVGFEVAGGVQWRRRTRVVPYGTFDSMHVGH
jgi:hypothetical protein